MKKRSLMSFPPRPRPHEEFLQYLIHEDLRLSYERKRRLAVRKVRKQFLANQTEIVERLRRGLKEDDDHGRVLNACIYPFARGEVPGYFFVRAAPLVEMNLENLDFLIVCLNPPRSGEVKVAIFGEAKGPINDPDRVLQEMRSRIDVLEQNWDKVRRTYLSEEMPREFVVGVLASDAHEMSKSVIKKGGARIVWSVDFSSNHILSLDRPDLDRSDRTIRATMMHKNDSLNQILNKLATSATLYTFFEQSHIVAKLRILTAVDKVKEDGTFTFNDVETLVKEALDYVLDDSVIRRETSTIIEWGRNIGFVTEVVPGHFKIKSRYKNAADRDGEIENLWINYRLSQEANLLVDAEVASLQTSFESERAKRPTLPEIFPSETLPRNEPNTVEGKLGNKDQAV
ncbi:MAG: hypothetical protein ABSD49_09745 [Candidatus Bathyarchaeia archaeon]